MNNNPLYIAFVWHMHQPYYKNLSTGEISLPWVRLHGTKDYLDMLEILSSFPRIHQTFNLVPSLIEQIDEYVRGGLDTKEVFLALSKKEVGALSSSEKQFMLQNFFMSNLDTMIKPYPRYRDLLEKRGEYIVSSKLPNIINRFNDQDYLDLQVLFNLAWVDPIFKQKDSFLKGLHEKGAYYTEDEKQLLLKKQFDILEQIIPSYKKFQDSGQIEISTSPYFHPILPLLCNSGVAKESDPNLQLPSSNINLTEDAKWHLKNAVGSYERHFNRKPRGLWPSEGSVSEQMLPLVIDAGIRWIATDQDILFKSDVNSEGDRLHFKAYTMKRNDTNLNIIFRDKLLSDLLGFVYTNWDASHAVEDFIGRLYDIKKGLDNNHTEKALVPIILDGENAWEYYQNDGRDFLNLLYERLSKDDTFEVVTVSEYLDLVSPQDEIRKLFPGSWINANFNIWIGHKEKNKAWDYLSSARDFLINFSKENPDNPKLNAAWRNLYIAQGSDWNWWYGDDHSSDCDEEFDKLFRENLKACYKQLDENPPEYLNLPIKEKLIKALVEPVSLITPCIDGKVGDYFEWLNAGCLNAEKLFGSMHQTTPILKQLFYGFDQKNIYVRIDLNKKALKEKQITVILDLGIGKINRFSLPIITNTQRINVQRFILEGDVAFKELESCASAFYNDVLEFSVSLDEIKLKGVENMKLRILIEQDENIIKKIPDFGFIEVSPPKEDYELHNWQV